jgi:C4-dicarboxylate transporter, DctM subunit
MPELSSEATGVVGIALLLVLILVRVPIGVALGGVSFFGIWYLVGDRAALGLLAEIPYEFAAHWSLSSIPMFLLMGYFCFHAGLTAGLFRLARLWLSWLPGGLAIASIQGAAMFSAVTGSSLACAAAMGRIAVPEMLKCRYDEGLATGTVAAAGTIGSLIPPSILLIIYGIIVEMPISHLFVGAILPGVLTAILYSIMVLLRVIARPALAPAVHETVSLGARVAALKDTWPVVVLVVGVLGGLFAGVFTPTEAGAVGASLSFLIALARRALDWRTFRLAVSETLYSTAAIFIIAIGAQLLTRFLGLSGVPAALSGLVGGAGYSQLEIILIVSAVLLVLGMFLDPIGIMLLTLPILMPVLDAAQINLIWFGVFMTKWLEVALITPPVGLNVFVVKGIVGDRISTERIFHGIGWFVATDLVTVGLMIAFPAIVLFLPSLLR